MYSDKIIDRHIERIYNRHKDKLVEHPKDYVWSVAEHLQKSLDDNGEPKRAWTNEENAFIRNERLMSTVNFKYWCERYWTIALDGGGIGKLKLAPSQTVALERCIAPAEERMYEAKDKKESVEGLLFYWHKARQLYATALARALCMHRETTNDNVRGLSASVDEDKIQELYDRDKLGYDSLPFYLKPPLIYDVKSQHLHLGEVNSRMLYQIASQKSGMGQGRQFDVHHLTECSFWEQPELHIDYVLNPAIPRSIRTLGIRESTANGNTGWWHDETEAARKGRSGRWNYIFIPWYAVPEKYQRTAPVHWTPADITLAHAKVVLETSHEFIGHSVTLTRNQLYWYEAERRMHLEKGMLALFLTNYCATPEESFQHVYGNAAFSTELMDRIRGGVVNQPQGFEVGLV